MINLIKCILRFHDDLSQKAVFEPIDTERQAAFIQAAAIRELIKLIKTEVIQEKDKEKFKAIISEHIEAMSRRMFWDRKVEIEDE